MSEYLERLRKKRDCPEAQARLEQQKQDKAQSDKEAMYESLFAHVEPLSDGEDITDGEILPDEDIWSDDNTTPVADMWDVIDEIETDNSTMRIASLQEELTSGNTEETVQLPLYERVWFKYGASSLGLLAACAEIYRAFKY